MDIFDELEKMAFNAASDSLDDTQTPSTEAIPRWERLFGYSHPDTMDMIERHRSNIARRGDEHWEIVREEKVAQGYDREAYEHELEIGLRKIKAFSGTKNGGRHEARKERYIVKLEEDLTTGMIQEAIGVNEKPEVIEGSGEDRDASFCVVDSEIRQALLERFSTTRFKPTFVRLTSPAAKNLLSNSLYPTLGIDSTLPQFRPCSGCKPFLPAQNEYPVWYFFYGTLADKEVLTRHLSLTEEPSLYPAAVTRAVIKTWGGKYRALVDGPDSVRGSAFQVMFKGQEDALRAYETDKYEVVRCLMEFDGKVVEGCTFRFVGEMDS